MMLSAGVQVWLSTEPVDMRRGHDGLLALVRSLGIADPYSGHLFVFLGRRSDRCKILYWSRGGFWVSYKRLERGRFRLPEVPEGARSVTMVSRVGRPDRAQVGRCDRGRLRDGVAAGARVREVGRPDPQATFARAGRRLLGGFRKDSPSMSMTWAWWSRRSMAALASRASLNSGGHSSMSRLDVMTIGPTS
jgi:transposase